MTQKTIIVSIETHERLSNLGKKNETFDAIISRLLNKVERKKAE